LEVGQDTFLIYEINTSVCVNEPHAEGAARSEPLFEFHAPSNSNRSTYYPGFGFQRRDGIRPTSEPVSPIPNLFGNPKGAIYRTRKSAK
jgi:hypothetical protein